MAVELYTLPKLPYAYNALEPSISSQIMELHHAKHHQTYVTNLNKALQSHQKAVETGDIAAQIALLPAIRFNGGGHVNHSLFWQNLAPPSSADARADAAPGLMADIAHTWGGYDKFKASFSAALLAIQGSGWGWLVREPQGGLHIATTKDQDPVVGGEVPIFGVDMWEHAYYLQYLNGKAAYVENIWNVVNWRVAEQRYHGSLHDVFGALRASV